MHAPDEERRRSGEDDDTARAPRSFEVFTGEEEA